MGRRRLAGIALAGLLTVGAAASSVAAPAAKRAAAPKAVNVTCKLSLTEQIMPGSTILDPSVSNGEHIGMIACRGFGSGVIAMPYTAQDDGSDTGSYKAYFDNGALHGKFALLPVDSQPTDTTGFYSSTETGTITVTGGTGGDVAVRGKGTLNCSTADGIHTSCSVKLKVTL